MVWVWIFINVCSPRWKSGDFPTATRWIDEGCQDACGWSPCSSHQGAVLFTFLDRVAMATTTDSRNSWNCTWKFRHPKESNFLNGYLPHVYRIPYTCTLFFIDPHTILNERIWDIHSNFRIWSLSCTTFTFQGATGFFPQGLTAIGTLLAHEAGVDQEDIVEASQAAPEEDEDLNFFGRSFFWGVFFLFLLWGPFSPSMCFLLFCFEVGMEKFRKVGFLIFEKNGTDENAELRHVCCIHVPIAWHF